MKTFLFTSFRIPSNSMEPALVAGDHVLVNKLLFGTRLLNISVSTNKKQVFIYRFPGFQKIHRNDVLVFNFPLSQTWSKIEMDYLKYYIKRCIGLAGDTLSIMNGYYTVNGATTLLGNLESQTELSILEADIANKKVFNSYPDSTIIDWTIKNYGPLYIPKKGDTINLNIENFVLYHKLIEWEQKSNYVEKNCNIYLDDKLQTKYCFLHNYYFMAGDNTLDSQDSRYWGLLPEEFIIGKATIIWKSIEPYDQSLRWNRMLKRIQ